MLSISVADDLRLVEREDNIALERRVNRQLRRQGWKVIRIWQHSLKKSPDAYLHRIHCALTLMRVVKTDVQRKSFKRDCSISASKAAACLCASSIIAVSKIPSVT
jgi:G:T-mismatch repair DNA endonuclease (very short patch repair protein)